MQSNVPRLAGVPPLPACADVRSGRERVQHGNNEGLHNITFVWLAGAPNVQLASGIKPPVRFILQCRYMTGADSGNAAFGSPANIARGTTVTGFRVTH